MITTVTEATHDYDASIDLQSEFEEIILRESCEKSTEKAARLASAIIDALKKRRGGDTIYISKGVNSVERKLRDRAIRNEYNGRNRLALCAKYRVSKARLYQILAKSAC